MTRRRTGVTLVLALAAVLPAVPAEAVGGQPLWTASVTGPDATDVAGGVAVDPARDAVYVTGEIDDRSGSGYYGLLVAYTDDGQERWRRGDLRVGRDVAVTSDGTVLQFLGARNAEDDGIGVRAYTARGRSVWSSEYRPTGQVEPVGMAFDDVHGVVYAVVQTYATGTGGPSAYTTVAFDLADGDLLWVRDFPGQDPLTVATAVATDPARGVVYVTGFEEEARGWAATTVAYDGDGEQLWVVREDRAVFGRPDDIGVDPADGTVYVAGSSGEYLSGPDALVTVAYGPDGSLRWVRSLPSGREYASNSALAIDPSSGGVVVVSVRDSSAIPPEPPAVVVREYGPEGSERWRRQRDEQASRFGHGVVVDPATGRVHVATQNDATTTVSLLSLSSAGRPEGRTRYVGTVFADLALEPDNGLVVVATTEDRPGTYEYDWLTLAYSAS